MLRLCYRFSTFPHRLSQEYQLKLQTVLGQVLEWSQPLQNFKINDQIMISGNVRLIDKNNKLVGVLPLDEARRRAVSTVQDLVLINADSSPAVCRILNYSEEMGTRFMKEIIAGEADKREKLLNRSTKMLKLSTKISSQDLRVKSQTAKELLKKGQQVRVQIICETGEVPQAQNVLMSFRDLSIGFMTPLEDISVREQENKDEEVKKKDRQPPKQIVDWTFRSIEAVFEKQQQYGLEEVQRLIDLQFKKLSAPKFQISAAEIEAVSGQADDESLNYQLQLETMITRKQLFNERRQRKQSKSDPRLLSIMKISESDVQNSLTHYQELEALHGEEQAPEKYIREVKMGVMRTQERVARIVRTLRSKQIS